MIHNIFVRVQMKVTITSHVIKIAFENDPIIIENKNTTKLEVYGEAILFTNKIDSANNERV